jgi:hypothetical protein
MEFNGESVVYTCRQSLQKNSVTLSNEIKSRISNILSSREVQSYVDQSIGSNPTPGERHYDTRESFYLKVPQQNLEIKILLSSPPTEQIRKLVEIFLVAFEKCRKRQ